MPRPTRRAAQASKVAVQKQQAEEEEDDVVSDVDKLEREMSSEVDQDVSTSAPSQSAKAKLEAPPAKRQKTKPVSTKKANATVSAKSKGKGKGRRKLDLITEIPLDVSLEIFSHLPPKDILSLSRSSKILRETLMTRKALSVWKTARERTGAPECPPWMSEPAWAALIFGNACQSCGAKNVQKSDFFLMRRICVSCRKRRCVAQANFHKKFPGIDKSMLDLLFRTNVGGWGEGFSATSRWYWDDDITSIASKLEELEADVRKKRPNAKEALENFKLGRAEMLSYIHENYLHWQKWQDQQIEERLEVTHAAQNKRLDQIKAKFKELGYKESDVDFLAFHPETKGKAKLTDRSWIKIREALEPKAQEQRVKRFEREYASLYRERRQLIDDRYQQYKRTLPPSLWKYLPRTWDLCLLEPFLKLARANAEEHVAADVVDQAFGDIAQLIEAEAARRRDEVSLLLRYYHPDRNSDAVDSAMSVFECAEKSCSWNDSNNRLMFGWDGIQSHHCRPESEGLDDKPPLFEAYSRWNVLEVFDAERSKLVALIICAAGLDPSTATVNEMDELDLRFGCPICEFHLQHKGESSSPAYTWRSLLWHWTGSGNKHDILNFVENSKREAIVLSKEVAEKVKDQEASDTKWAQTRWTCAHCAIHLNNLQHRPTVIEHLHESHSMLEPVAGKDLLFFERFPTDLNAQPVHLITGSQETNETL